MKKILITGANSYIGTSFENYMKQWSEDYRIDTIDMKNNNWKQQNFSIYDVIYHVAGLAHSDFGKINDDRKNLYYEVNTYLTIEVAKKAKEEGVKQFIFMSSAIVYGESASIGRNKIITKDTPLQPTNFYGDSKVQAEKGLKELEDEKFKVVILRPPMIYGRGSKGNYPLLVKLAKKMPFFPDIENQRSMLYIGNFVLFVKLMIDNEETGVFWPQNSEYINTSKMVKMIAKTHGKKIILVKGFAWSLRLLSYFTKLVNKAFGNLCYEQSMSLYRDNYQVFSLKQSIEETEG